jgi:hypothetical protein
MAERVGFEPTIPGKRDTAFRERGLQPLGNLSRSGPCPVNCIKNASIAFLCSSVNGLFLRNHHILHRRTITAVRSINHQRPFDFQSGLAAHHRLYQDKFGVSVGL